MRHVDSQHLSFTRTALIAAMLGLPLFVRPALAQIATTGMISGTVSDPTGSAIAGAKVTITNTATGAALETVSNSKIMPERRGPAKMARDAHQTRIYWSNTALPIGRYGRSIN